MTEFTAQFRYKAGTGEARIDASAIPVSATDDDLIDLFWVKIQESARDIGLYSSDEKTFLKWAREVQTTRDTVKSKGRPREYSDEQIAKVRQLKRVGFTWAQIVEATGVKKSSARQMCEGQP